VQARCPHRGDRLRPRCGAVEVTPAQWVTFGTGEYESAGTGFGECRQVVAKLGEDHAGDAHDAATGFGLGRAEEKHHLAGAQSEGQTLAWVPGGSAGPTPMAASGAGRRRVCTQSRSPCH
jgi:hypothetical protein